MKEKITVERLKEVLCYDPNSGIWTWLINKSNIRKGSRAGNTFSRKGCSSDYRRISIDNTRVQEFKNTY